MTVEAIFLDLFETLVTEYDLQFSSRPSLPERLKCDETLFRKEYRARVQDLNRGRIDYPTMLREIAERVDARVDDTVLEQIYADRLATKGGHLMRVERVLLDILEYLKQKGLRLGVISNTDASEVATWESCPLAPCLQSVSFSHIVGHVKPHPEIYYDACRQASVLPEHALFIGDGGSDELTGAARIGMRPYCAAWYITQYPRFATSERINQRANGYPVLWHIKDVTDQVVKICRLV